MENTKKTSASVVTLTAEKDTIDRLTRELERITGELERLSGEMPFVHRAYQDKAERFTQAMSTINDLTAQLANKDAIFASELAKQTRVIASMGAEFAAQTALIQAQNLNIESLNRWAKPAKELFQQLQSGGMFQQLQEADKANHHRAEQPHPAVREDS